MLSWSPRIDGRSGARSASVSASRMRISALLYRRALPRALEGDSVCGLRTIAIGSVQGGGLLMQLFFTKGNCMLVAPVSELVTNPFKVLPDEMLGKLELAKPATLG